MTTFYRIPRQLRLLGPTLAVLALAAGAASGASLQYTVPAPLASTDWVTTCLVPRFDPHLGCLQSVCIKLDGHVEGSVKLENFDTVPVTVTTRLFATLSLKRPDNSLIGTCVPEATHSDLLGAWDGLMDFGGGSGRVLTGLAADNSTTACLTALPDLSLFTGTGSIGLPMAAVGSCTAVGARSLSLQYSAKASASLLVTYTYAQCTTSAAPTTWGAIKSLYR